MSQLATPTTISDRTPNAAGGISLALLWQLVLGIASGAAALSLGFQTFNGTASNTVISTVFAIIGAIFAVVSFASLLPITRRQHRGRTMALAVNYLIFLGVLFYLFQRIGIFDGLDDVADTFQRGLPILAVAFIGYLLATAGDNERKQGEREAQIRQLGYVIMGGFVLVALFLMGTLNGIVTLATRLITDPTTLGITVVALLLGIALWYWWRADTADRFNATVRQTEMLNGYLLLSPNLIGFLIFFAGPLIFSLYVSTTEWSAFGAPNFIGADNYANILSLNISPLADATQRASEVLPDRYVELSRFSVAGTNYVLGAKDKLFWLALRNTLLFAFMVVPLSVFPALVLANILNSKIPGMTFFRTLYFIPSVAAVVGVATIWNWLYNSTSGFINYGITQAIDILNRLPGVAVTDPALRWLSNSDTALLAIVIMAAWRLIGFNTVLFLAGLQGISRDVYEAAEVDGADTFRKFMSITIPLLAPTTFFVVTTNIIQSLQLFDEVIVLINPPAGPNNSTLTAVLYLYQNGFQRFNLGYASAVAWVLFGVIFIVTLIQFRIQRSGEAY